MMANNEITILDKHSSIPVYGIFRADILGSYNFNSSEVSTFYHFFIWAVSGKMKSKQLGGKRYYFIDYESLSISWYTNKKTLKNYFNHLAGSLPKGTDTNLKFPLEQITIREGKRNSAYFGFDFGVMRVLIFWEKLKVKRREELEAFVSLEENKMADLFGDKIISSSKTKRKYRRDRILKEEVYNIIYKLKQIKRPDGIPLFQDLLPEEDRMHYTKALDTFRMKLDSLYMGRFLAEYKINREFLKRNSDLIGKEAENMIKSCAGSWKRISQVLEMASMNYLYWFKPEYLPESKGWLPRQMTEWVFQPRSYSSVFMACLEGKPLPVRYVATKRLYTNIPKKARDYAAEIEPDGVDSKQYWSKIRQVYNWYKKNSVRIKSEDGNASYWLRNNFSDWFVDSYMKYIMRLTDGGKGLYISHLGVGNKTWVSYCRDSSRIHNIKIKII